MNELGLAIALIGGLAIGFVIAWIFRGREVGSERRGREELKNELEQFDTRFKAIAGDVLRSHAKDFLSDFEQAKKLSDAQLDNRDQNFQKTVSALNASLESVRTKMSEFEQQRAQQFGVLEKGIQGVFENASKVLDTANSLKAVLSTASAVRGRWGETVLKNLLEQSGLTEGIDFHVQKTMEGEGSSLRPDFVINLPGDLQLAVDSKAGLEEFFKAVEEFDDLKKREHVLAFARNLRGHVQNLASKEYQRHLDGKMPYVVMFVPGEAAVRAAFEIDDSLYREAQEKRVMLASPATIMPLVLLIAHAWKQYRSEQNAVRLVGEVRTLGERLKVFVKHFAEIGGALSKATEKYNHAAGSWDTRIHPQIERINGLGGNLDDIPALPQVTGEPRPPSKAA